MTKVIFAALALLISTQAVADVPTSVVSTSHKMSDYGSDNGYDIRKLCDIISQDDKGWPKNGSMITCLPLKNGMVAILAKNKYGQMAVYANLSDRQNDALYGGDYLERYSNNLGQSFSISLEWQNSGISRGRDGSVIQNGHFNVSGTFHSGGKTLTVGEIESFQ